LSGPTSYNNVQDRKDMQWRTIPLAFGGERSPTNYKVGHARLNTPKLTFFGSTFRPLRAGPANVYPR